MKAIVRNLISVTPPTQQAPRVSYWVEPGSGRTQWRCGKLRRFGHFTGEVCHVEAGYYRCRRPECPVCWNQKGGWLDEAEKRILAGIGKGRDEGWEDSLQEVIIESQFAPGQEAWMLDPGERRRIIAEFRAAAGSRSVPPGAWVLHFKPTTLASDRCPQRPHLHIFTVGTLPHEVGLGLLVTRVHKPAVRECLIGCTRGYTAGLKTEANPHPKDRCIQGIGWFGRTKPKTVPGLVIRAEPARFCHTCSADVPKYDWNLVEPLVEAPLGEGSYVLKREDVRILRPEFMPRGGIEEESFALKPRFYSSRPSGGA
jgi:hypothetical protein